MVSDSSGTERERRARIPDDELEFLENIIADSVYVSRLTKTLAFGLSNPEEIALCAGILSHAGLIRQMAIDWMVRRKEESLAAKKVR